MWISLWTMGQAQPRGGAVADAFAELAPTRTPLRPEPETRSALLPCLGCRDASLHRFLYAEHDHQTKGWRFVFACTRCPVARTWGHEVELAIQSGGHTK
jgi:hypothetical protein